MKEIVLVTGANGNIGRSVVECFHEAGFHIIAVDAKAPKELPAFKNYTFYEIDLLEVSAVENLVKEILEKHGKIAAGILLAGGFAMADMQSISSDDIRKMIDLNFFTAFDISRLLFNHMKEHQYGRLVFVGARPALQPQQAGRMIPYALSKSLLFKYAEILNAEAQGSNIVTTVVVPSTVDTLTNRKDMPDADTSKWVKPEEIAEVLKFVCSSNAKILRETVLKLYNEV